MVRLACVIAVHTLGINVYIVTIRIIMNSVKMLLCISKWFDVVQILVEHWDQVVCIFWKSFINYLFFMLFKPSNMLVALHSINDKKKATYTTCRIFFFSSLTFSFNLSLASPFSFKIVFADNTNWLNFSISLFNLIFSLTSCVCQSYPCSCISTVLLYWSIRIYVSSDIAQRAVNSECIPGLQIDCPPLYLLQALS